MRKVWLVLISLFLIFITTSNIIFSQAVNADSLLQFKTITAGEKYKKSALHKWLWGSNYRNLWTSPVTVKILNLDTAYSGLTAFKIDTNNAAKILYLKNAAGKEYLLISVNRTPGKFLPPQLQDTYLEDRVNDQVSITNPYAVATIPYMADAAKVYSIDPTYVFVPKQPALNVYNDVYGNDFYKLEQQANIDSGNTVSTSAGNYIETFHLLDILKYNLNSSIDKNAFIRERLFDMFVNDWNRGENKWLWAERKEGDKKIYVPVPKDRDAAYSKYNGKFTRLALGLTGINSIQSFDKNLKNVNSFNFKEKDIDRSLLNEATLIDWQTIAADLQQSLTDEVIQNAIQQLPKEIYPLTGHKIIEKLKARRNHLTEWATEYYNFLSKEVEVHGSYQNEEFDVQRMNDETTVRVFSLNSRGGKNYAPYYSRIFKSSETKEIRLFGLAGEDKYVITGNTDNDIRIRIIEGANKDSVIDATSAGVKNKNVIVYGNNIETASETQVKIINDTSSFKSYRYNWFNYEKKGITPYIFYSNEDRLFVGATYRKRHYVWDKEPFASNQAISLHYSLMEKAFSITYKAIIPKLVAKSDFALFVNYDAIRWTYFFGLGNDTKFDKDHKIEYYIMRTRQWIVQPSLVRSFGKSTISVFASLNGIKVINDPNKYLSTTYLPNKSVYDWQTFAGGGLSYSFQQLNNAIVPTKGVYFNAAASGAQNLKTSSGHYFKYAGTAYFYIPLTSKFSLNIRMGAQTVTGNPEFYQYASVGGILLRGVVLNRFWGKTAFYNTNDLRYISPVHTHFFAGKAGFLVFIDDGRVWMPGEKSNTLHKALGGGVILAPFNLLYADFSYGRSKNEGTLQVRVTFFIP